MENTEAETSNPEPVQGTFEIPQYRCHKVVRAGKIADIQPISNDEDSDAWLHLRFGENSGAPVKVDAKFMSKHNPKVGGYFVMYQDNYESYSPPEAFESGYSLIESDEDEDQEVIDALLIKAASANHSDDALKFAQAAGMVADAMYAMDQIKQKK